MTDDTLSLQFRKARDRNHAIDEADRMWAPQAAEDIDPVLLQPTETAPYPPAEPAPANTDFESERPGRYGDVHRQNAQINKGVTPTEPGTYGQGDTGKPNENAKEIKT